MHRDVLRLRKDRFLSAKLKFLDFENKHLGSYFPMYGHSVSHEPAASEGILSQNPLRLQGMSFSCQKCHLSPLGACNSVKRFRNAAFLRKMEINAEPDFDAYLSVKLLNLSLRPYRQLDIRLRYAHNQLARLNVACAAMQP